MIGRSPAYRFLPHLLACGIVAVSSSNALGVGDEEIARFKREYPAALRQIEKRYAEVQGRAHVTVIRQDDNERRTRDVTFASLGPLRKFESIYRNTENEKNSQIRVVCIDETSFSGFTLRRPAG